MCWISDNAIRQVAKEDIPVFKLAIRQADGKIYPYYYGGHLQYKVGKIATSSIHLFKNYNESYEIGEGLHSYSPKCTILQVLFCSSRIKVLSRTQYHLSYYETNNLCLLLCTIPKGTRYYVNDVEEYVSAKLKVEKAVDFPRVSYIAAYRSLEDKVKFINNALTEWLHGKAK